MNSSRLRFLEKRADQDQMLGPLQAAASKASGKTETFPREEFVGIAEKQFLLVERLRRSTGDRIVDAKCVAIAA